MSTATLNTAVARQADPRCLMVREGVNNRRTPCNRPAAKKWGYRYCGNCAAGMVCKQLNDGARSHKANCLGCGLDCCSDRSKCVPGRCRLFVNRIYVDVTADQVRRAANGERTDWDDIQAGTRFNSHGSTWLVEYVADDGRYTVRAIAGRYAGQVAALGGPR